MWRQMKRGLRMMLAFTLVTGLIYPAVITGLAHVFFRNQAEGSLIRENGAIIGSQLLAQKFTRPEYFWPRPSAAGSDGYDATASSPSNLGPTNAALIARVEASTKKFHADNPEFQGAVPVDLVTTSGSGLDPDITPAGADAQAQRVARARGVDVNAIGKIISKHTEMPALGLIGEPRVNVLMLNIDLDKNFPVKSAREQ